MLLLLAIFGCSDPDPKDTGSTLDTADDTDGTVPAACQLLDAGTRLDLELGCADGLCGGTSYPEAVALLGEPDACAATGYRATCSWGDLSADFPDCDADGAADEEELCDQFDQTITVTGAWDGSDGAGLGLGVDAACWEEVLGAPLASGGWEFGTNPLVTVTIAPADGLVETITLRWTRDE